MPRADGSGPNAYCLVSIYPVKVQGVVLGVVGMVRDVTAQRREEQRRELLARASRVFGASLDLLTTFHIVRQRRPAIVISDIGMPVEDGYAFIDQVRTLPDKDGGRTPAVALTAHARSKTAPGRCFRASTCTSPSRSSPSSSWP